MCKNLFTIIDRLPKQTKKPPPHTSILTKPFPVVE